MGDTEAARAKLEHGDKFPYDAGKEFWDDDRHSPPTKDWAHRAARGVIADLWDRRGIKHELDEVDHDVRGELVAGLAEIIRLAYAQERPLPAPPEEEQNR